VNLLIIRGNSLKAGIMIIGAVSILMVVVFASGCISNEKILYQYNLSAGQSPNYIGAQNITVPNGTSSIKVQCVNLTKINSSLNTSYVSIYLLNTVPVTFTINGNNTDFIASYNKSVVVQKTINLANETSPLSENFTFNNTQVKGILIVNVNAKGLIQIITP
jgi:hypothetical protein